MHSLGVLEKLSIVPDANVPAASEIPLVPTRLLIGGEWCEAASGKRFATLNPATEEVLAEIAEAGAADVDAAVAAARKALRLGPGR